MTLRKSSIDITMCSKPLISVLIPVYNVELFVFEAVNSICNQTYKNLEIIVVDDCSTDRTYEVVEEIMKNDNRIRLYRNETNLKIAKTLNYALTQATGKFIARMDGDDFSEPTKIEKQYLFLINNPEFVLVGTNYILEDEHGIELSRTHYLSDFSIIEKTILYESPVAHIWMTTKKIYDEIGEYRIPSVEDYDFLLRLISRGYKISNLDEYLYRVRLRNGNTTSTMGLVQRKSIEYVITLFKERKLNMLNLDSFSNDSYNRLITLTDNEKREFLKSSEYFDLFLKYRNSSFFKSAVFLMLSIIKSPKAQIKYFYRRVMLRVIKWIN